MTALARWSCEHVVADHKDLQANAMALDCTGQFAILAGRRYIGVVRLDQPSVLLKKLPRHSKWEVNVAEWNPHQAQVFALACNQRVELVEWKDGELSPRHIFRQHTRVVSDLNWSPFEPYILATASIDNFIHLWDIRDPRRPSLSLSTVAGATQVKWNKIAPTLLATSHEGYFCLWDPRKGTTPVQYISAHLSKINGIDWSSSHEHHLATSSQDCSVKFWDVTNPKHYESILSSRFPVWRARYTPFGNGMMTVVVPQLRRGENSLILWNTSSLDASVHTFVGHTDVVLEFGWRKEDNKDWQLVTWSKDQTLRIWTIDSHLQKLCGYVTADSSETENSGQYELVDSHDMTDTTSQTSASSSKEIEGGGHSTPPNRSETSEDEGTPSITCASPSQPQNLQQEFSLVNINIPNVSINEMDANKRSCTVTVTCGKIKVYLRMNFPATYPNNSPPTFQFCKGTSAEKSVRSKIVKVLRTTSQQQVKRNRPCLEPCLRQLVATLESFAADDRDSSEQDNKYRMEPVIPPYLSMPAYGSYQDASVPFPRTSGARFCGSDYLICFVRPPHLQRMNAPTEVTPRSLSALGAYLSSHILPITSQASVKYAPRYQPVTQSPTGDSSVSISSFYFHDKRQRMRGKHSSPSTIPKPPSYSGAVVIYNITGLMPTRKCLAENYVLSDRDIPGMCAKNAAIANAFGRKDLIQVWNLAALIAEPLSIPCPDPDVGVPWAQHPFGRKLLQSLLDFYVKHNDIQTVVMLCCTFGCRTDDSTKLRRQQSDLMSGNSQLSGKWWLKPGGSPYHTVVPADTQWGGWNVVGTPKRNRSNSWSDSVEEFRFADYIQDPKELEREEHEANTRMLDEKQTLQYDQYKKVYAELLYRWNLLEQRAQVLKYVSTPPEKHKGVEFLTECHHCQHDVQGPQCIHCKNYSMQCAICHVAVKGASNFCLCCGHGGHTFHMLEWFQQMETCPAGCGCNCLDESENLFGP